MIAVAPHIRFVADKDGGLIIDIKRNATFALDPTTLFVWRKLEAQIEVEQIAIDLSVEAGEDIGVVRRGLAAFLRNLKQKKMLIEGDHKFHERHAAIAGLTLLLLYDLCVPPLRTLRLRSLWILYSIVKRWKIHHISSAPDRAADIYKAVDIACSWYPKQVKCLQRSFAATYLLRRYGIAAEFVLGAQKLPFEAHAWLEVEKTVVYDRPEAVKRFTVFDRC